MLLNIDRLGVLLDNVRERLLIANEDGSHLVEPQISSNNIVITTLLKSQSSSML